MSSKEEAYYTLLLRQYIEGTISAEDKFILEKRALDDPFLFEALEGYQNNDNQTLESIQLLDAKIKKTEEVKTTKRIPLFNYGIAASLILLLGFGLWFFNDVTLGEENIAMNTSVQEEKIDDNKTHDVFVQSETTDGEVQSSNKQYDTPKAVISQTDNETIREQSKVKQTPTPAFETSETYVKQQAPPSVKNTQILSSKNESTPSNRTDIATILNQDKANIQAGAQSVEEEQTFEEVAVEKELKRQPVAARSQASSVSPELNTVLSKNEYFPSIDGNTLVAPKGGMTNLLIGINQVYQTRKLKELNNQQFSIISFKINKDGAPTDLKLISTDNSECGEKLLNAIEKERKWYTIPANFESTISLKLPCN